MTLIRSRALAVLAGGALLVGALSACGSDDEPTRTATTPTASASASASEAASSSTPSGSATPEAVPTTGVAAPGERLTRENLVPTMLAAMRAKKTAHMTMEIGSSIGADADVRYDGARTDMRMSMDMGPSKVVVIMVDSVMYVQQGPGTKYMKIDRNDGALGSLLGQMSSFGPESSVSAMQGAVEKVEYVGRGTMDGVAVSRYRVTLDSSSIASSLGAGLGSADLPEKVTYDLYVDSDNLMRRIDLTVAKQRMVMTVSHWGEPVDISAPPASQVQ